MSNIAGKAYAMNVVTPINGALMRFLNKGIFWLMGKPLLRSKLNGLATLSMIHYARWVIVKDSQFPRLSDRQPRERLRYSYTNTADLGTVLAGSSGIFHWEGSPMLQDARTLECRDRPC